MEEWREGGAVMDIRDTGETDTLSGEQWREEETTKGDWGQHFRIQDTSYGHFETVVCFTSALLMNIDRQDITTITSSLTWYSIRY